MPRGWVFVVALGCASPVLAQSQDRPEEIIDPNGPGAHHGDSNRVPLPPAGPSRDAFLREFITVDPQANAASLGGHSISAYDFYKRVDRPDLAARADERTRQRIWLISGAVLVLAGGVTGGTIAFATAQNPNDPSCAVDVYTYNACIDAHNKNRNIGIALIATSVAVSAGMFTWAMLIPEMVTTPQETLTLATGYNRGLSKKYGAPGATFRLLPALAPGYAGLVARLTF
ncbi:MAG: hypothetical protein ACXWLG_14855 [Myxococcaceae bacterium]